jgi:hypothetical protein
VAIGGDGQPRHRLDLYQECSNAGTTFSTSADNGAYEHRRQAARGPTCRHNNPSSRKNSLGKRKKDLPGSWRHGVPSWLPRPSPGDLKQKVKKAMTRARYIQIDTHALRWEFSLPFNVKMGELA